MALANAQPHESRLYYEFSHLYDLLFRRVFYPRIAIINHFRSPNPTIAGFMHAIDPLTRRVGWTTLRLSDVVDWQALHVERQWKTSPRSLFTIVVARNAKAVPAARTVAGRRTRRTE